MRWDHGRSPGEEAAGGSGESLDFGLESRGQSGAPQRGTPGWAEDLRNYL